MTSESLRLVCPSLRSLKTFTVLFFFLLCPVVLFSCISSTQKSHTEGELPWKEPFWVQDRTEEITIRWKLLPGSEAEYHESQQARIHSDGKTIEETHFLSLGYQVEEVFHDATARVSIHGKALETQSELLRFMMGSSPCLGRFSISTSGMMTDIEGIIDLRSLPTFPTGPVHAGAKWTGTVSLAFAPTLPEAIARGECHYELVGLANVHGHQWAKVLFKADLEVPKQEFAVDKVIGIKPGETSFENGSAVIVGEVVSGRPAEKAGVLSGDKIIRIGNMDVNSWEDLALAIALLPCDAPQSLVLIRNNEEISLMVKPHAALVARMESHGSIEGACIFDVTAGLLIRMQIDPLTIHSLYTTDHEQKEISARVKSVIRLIRRHIPSKSL